MTVTIWRTGMNILIPFILPILGLIIEIFYLSWLGIIIVIFGSVIGVYLIQNNDITLRGVK